MDLAGTPRVVVIGGGFAGLFAARRLKHSRAHVTLIDRSTSHVFQPLLYQCATGILSEGQITAPLRTVFAKAKNVETVLAEAVDVDPYQRVVRCLRPDGSPLDVNFDYLLVGTGVSQSYFGHPEFEPFAPGMKTIDDALTIRRRIFHAFEMAETLESAEDRRDWMTFALVGAGPTGVEMAGQVAELADRTLKREFSRIDPEEAHIMLFDALPTALPQFGERLARKALHDLQKLGVEIHLGESVTSITETVISTSVKDGPSTTYPARTVLWTAGVAATPFAHKLAQATGAEQDKSGRVQVQPDLTIPGHHNIWVLGDVAAVTGSKLPGVAEVAIQGGFYAGKQIKRELAGKARTEKPFHYRNLGDAAYVSRGHALLKKGPIALSGILGWLAWGLIHLAFLTGFRNRFGALFTWMVTIGMGNRRERATTLRAVDEAPYPYVPARPDADRVSSPALTV